MSVRLAAGHAGKLAVDERNIRQKEMVEMCASVVLGSPSAKSLVISVMMLLVVLVPTAVRAEVMCYWCNGCDVYMPTQMKQCATECSVWYSSEFLPPVPHACA